MALWHLAQNISDPAMGIELLPAAGRPQKVTVVAVDPGKAGVPVFAEHRSLKVQSLWGEIFLRLGGERALKALGEADHPEASPNERQLEAVFPKDPVLILLDELVIYMAKLSERGQGNLLGFLNSLASVVSKRPQTVLVVTDPAGQVAYAGQAARIGAALVAATTKLDEIFGRKMTDFDPIGNEGARVIVRCLFVPPSNVIAKEKKGPIRPLSGLLKSSHVLVTNYKPEEISVIGSAPRRTLPERGRSCSTSLRSE